MKENPHFIHVTSDYGWIGNICWLNSSTTPSQDPMQCGPIVLWGNFSLKWSFK
jgi:hypothetical protein